MQHSFTKCDMKHSFATVEKVKVIFQKLLFLTFAVKKGKNWEKTKKTFLTAVKIIYYFFLLLLTLTNKNITFSYFTGKKK